MKKTTTEQEKREKAIEELHSILLSDCRRYGNRTCPRNTCSECAAARIYDNYIIRKEEEVRKEVVESIVNFIENNYSIDLAKEILIKFLGVEVEE